MNILIFVMTLILLLSTLTYARLDIFFKSHLRAKEWVILTQMSERSAYNQIMKKSVPKKKQTEEKKGKPPEKEEKSPSESKATPGYGKISYSWFLDKSFREKNKEAFPLVLDVLRKVIHETYQKQPFFRQLSERRADFVDQMIHEVIAVSESYNGQKNVKYKIKDFQDLFYAQWNDPELREAFAYMVQEGLVYKRPEKQDVTLFQNENEGKVSKELNELNESQASENISEVRKGFQSLRNYFNKFQNTKVRVFLAPEELLLAFYSDPKIVEKIVMARNRLYKEVCHGRTAEDATQEFEREFTIAAFEPILDFTVTKTNPKNR